MKLEELRKIIYEEVRKAVQAEIRDILVEAVDIASTPEQKQIQETIKHKPTTKPVNSFGLGSILQETAKGMSREDYTNALGTDSLVVESYTPVVTAADNMMNLPFIAQASKVLQASYAKDRERNGI